MLERIFFRIFSRVSNSKFKEHYSEEPARSANVMNNGSISILGERCQDIRKPFISGESIIHLQEKDF